MPLSVGVDFINSTVPGIRDTDSNAERPHFKSMTSIIHEHVRKVTWLVSSSHTKQSVLHVCSLERKNDQGEPNSCSNQIEM